MKCRKCGASVPTDSLFCNYCGTKIVRTSERGSQQTRPRDENFDDITTARQQEIETPKAKGQRILTIALIFLAAVVFAALCLVVFDVAKRHQRTIVNPGGSIEEASFEPIPTDESESEDESETDEPTTEPEIREGETFDYLGMTYLPENGALTLVKCHSLESIVELPDKIYGYPLRAIGEEAFLQCGHLQYIDIPEGVTKIGDYAFSYCTSLREIVIPSTVRETEFGTGVFDYASGFTVICIPDSFAYWLAYNNGIAWAHGEDLSVVSH